MNFLKFIYNDNYSCSFRGRFTDLFSILNGRWFMHIPKALSAFSIFYFLVFSVFSFYRESTEMAIPQKRRTNSLA